MPLQVNNLLVSEVARAIAKARGFDPDASYPTNPDHHGSSMDPQTGEQKFWGDALGIIAAWEILTKDR